MTQQVLPPPPNTPLLDDPTRDAIWRRYIEQLINRLILPGQIDHNDLNGLQGGTTDQYYHLTSSQHASVTSFASFPNNRVVVTSPTSSLATYSDLAYNSATSTLNAPILVTNGSTVTFTNLSALGSNGQVKFMAGSLGAGGGAVMLASTAAARIAYVDLIQTDGTPGAEQGAIAFGTVSSGALAERARITNAGQVVVGANAAAVFSGAAVPRLQIHGTSTFPDASVGNVRWSSSGSVPSIGPVQYLALSRGAQGAHTIVQNGDIIAIQTMEASDGVEFLGVAQVRVIVDGAPSVQKIPGRYEIWTTASSAASPTLSFYVDAAKDAYSLGGLRAVGNVSTAANIVATAGTFSGNLTAVAGSFTGNVSTSANVIASSGSFSGTLTVSGTGTHQFDGVVQAEMGTSASYAQTVNKANVNTTPVGNVGGGEDDLITYSLPANSMTGDGKGVRVTAWGTKASNANAKTVKTYFGTASTASLALAAGAAGKWRSVSEVFRTGSSTQAFAAQITEINTGFSNSTLTDIGVGSASQNDAGAITIKCTGTATADNDIVQSGMLVEFIN